MSVDPDPERLEEVGIAGSDGQDEIVRRRFALGRRILAGQRHGDLEKEDGVEPRRTERGEGTLDVGRALDRMMEGVREVLKGTLQFVVQVIRESEYC